MAAGPTLEQLIAAALGNADAATGDDDGGFSLMDLLHGTSDFFEGIVGDVADFVTGYGENAVAVASDPMASIANVPEDAVAMAKGVAHDYTHPVEYANRDPLWFMLDLMGGAALGAKAAGAGRRVLSHLDDAAPMIPEGYRNPLDPGTDRPYFERDAWGEDLRPTDDAYLAFGDIANLEHMYHISPSRNMHSIRKKGLGSGSRGESYWAAEPSADLVPTRNLQDPMLWRTRKDRGYGEFSQPDDSWYEAPLGDVDPYEWTMARRVEPSELEYLAESGRWVPAEYSNPLARTLAGIREAIIGDNPGPLGFPEEYNSNLQRLLREERGGNLPRDVHAEQLARGGLDDAAEEAAQADFAMTLEGLADEIVPEGTVVGSLDVEEIARNNARRLVAESEAEYNKLFQPGGITDNQGRLTPKGQMLQKLFMRARTREAGPATGPPGSSLGRNPDVLNPGAGQFYEGVNRATDESRRLMEDYPGKGGGRTTSKAMIDDETGKTVGGRRGGAIEQSVEVSNARGRARDPNWTIPPVWSESKLHLGGFRNKKGSFKEQGRFNPSKKGPTDPTPERPFDYESTYMSADDAEDALRIEAGPYDYAGGRLPVGRKKPRFPGDESPVIERQGRTAQDFENQMAAPWVHPDVQEFQAPPINPGASTMERLLAELVDEGIPEGEGRFVPGKYRPVEEPPPPTPSRMPQSTLEKAGVGRKAKRVGRTVEELEEWYRQQREEALRARRERY